MVGEVTGRSLASSAARLALVGVLVASGTAACRSSTCVDAQNLTGSARDGIALGLVFGHFLAQEELSTGEDASLLVHIGVPYFGLSEEQVRVVTDRYCDWATTGPLFRDMMGRSQKQPRLGIDPFSSGNIRLVDLDAVDPGPDDLFARTWLPGYSSDGGEALVRFAFGPADHGASATYLLRFDGSRWCIRWSNVAFHF